MYKKFKEPISNKKLLKSIENYNYIKDKKKLNYQIGKNI